MIERIDSTRLICAWFSKYVKWWFQNLKSEKCKLMDYQIASKVKEKY